MKLNEPGRKASEIIIMLRLLCDQNGEPLDRANLCETVEDVQPTGKRLKVLSAIKGANYTCVVTSHVAATSATAHLFVSSEWGSVCVCFFFFVCVFFVFEWGS